MPAKFRLEAGELQPITFSVSMEPKCMRTRVMPEAEIILSAAGYKFWTDQSLSGCRRGGSRWSGAYRAWSQNGKTCCRWKERTRSCPASALSTRRDTHRVAHPLFGLILHDDPTDARILVLAETLVREEDWRPKKRTGGQTCNARFRPTRRCRSPSGVARTGPTNNRLDRLPARESS
jgi:hypothetical protein